MQSTGRQLPILGFRYSAPDAPSVRLDDDLEAAAHPHFPHDGGDVSLDGSLRDIHLTGDLVVRASLAQETEHLLLPVRQIQVRDGTGGRGLALEVAVQDAARRSGREDLAPGTDGADRPRDLRRARRLEQETGGTGRDAAVEEGIIVERGEQEDPRSSAGLQNPGGRLRARAFECP